MADGRRRRRLRRTTNLSGLAGVTALALAIGSFLAGQPDTQSAPLPLPDAEQTAAPPDPSRPQPPNAAECVPSLLPEPEGRGMSTVSGADPTGRFIVGHAYSTRAGERSPLIWADGRLTVVEMPGEDQSLDGINSHGVAVGTSVVDGKPVPWLYLDGRLTRLPGIATGGAVAINDAGQILGWRGKSAVGTPVVWHSATSAPVDLPVPWGFTGTGRDIDEDGTVVGAVRRTVDEPYLWTPDGAGRPLPTPTVGGKPATSAAAYSIRLGWVGGLARFYGSGPRGASQWDEAVRWDPRTGVARTFPDIPGPVAVNREGWIVGTAVHLGNLQRANLNAFSTGARTGYLPLPPTYQDANEETVTNAITLADDGGVIAGSVNRRPANGEMPQPHAVQWRCPRSG